MKHARKLIVALVLLASAALVVQVQAFKRTTVTSISEITVTTTNQAALQLTVGTGSGNRNGTASYSGNSITLDFTKGKGAGTFSFAPPAAGTAGDKYRFRGLFRVTNTQSATKCVSVYAFGGNVNGLENIYLRTIGDPGDGTPTTSINSGGNKGSCVPVPGSTSVDVDFWWSATASAANAFTVRVDAE